MEPTNENKAITPYSFTLTFRVGGLVDSSLSPEETREKLHEELSLFYGDDGYELIDFREATPEEVLTYRKYLEENLEDETIN